MLILRLESKNTFFFMKYLRLKYDHILSKSLIENSDIKS